MQTLFLRRRWTALALLVIVLGFAVGAAFFLRSDGPQPVVPTTLETNALERFLGRGPWRDPGFRLTPEHTVALKRCMALAGKVRSTVNGVCPFAADEVRDELKTIRAEAPSCFYAEYLLGLWHQMNAEPVAAEAHYAKVLESAPVVLVQRLEFGDGRPIARLAISHIVIECNRVEEGALDPNLNLEFFDMITDADGSIRVPVYKTVFRVAAVANPPGFNTDWPSLGWFEARGRVGLLPTAVVTPKAGEAQRP